MDNPRITSAERRGLIILILVMMLITCVLCLRDCSVAHRAPADVIGRADSVQSILLSDTTTRCASEKASVKSEQASAKSESSGCKKSSRPRVSEPLPQRSPRDERVN